MEKIDFGNSWLMMCRFAASFVGFLSFTFPWQVGLTLR
jgi:hypothetical protein